MLKPYYWTQSTMKLVVLSVAVTLLTINSSSRVEAQVLPAVIGGVGGLVAGAHMTTGLYVLKTRATGWVMHSVEHLIEPAPEAIPLVVVPLAGAIIGYRSSSALTGAGIWGGVGLASGAVAGAAVGQLVWGDSEGRWAGGVMGSAAGLLIGAVLGAAKRRSGVEDLVDGTEAVEGVDLQLTLRSPWGGKE